MFSNLILPASGKKDRMNKNAAGEKSRESMAMTCTLAKKLQELSLFDDKAGSG